MFIYYLRAQHIRRWPEGRFWMILDNLLLKIPSYSEYYWVIPPAAFWWSTKFEDLFGKPEKTHINLDTLPVEEQGGFLPNTSFESKKVPPCSHPHI